MGGSLLKTFKWVPLSFLVLLGLAVACSADGNAGEATLIADERVPESGKAVITRVEAKSVSLPEGMEELIGTSDVIAVGRVGKIVREVAEGGFKGAFDREGNPVKQTLVPHTYFELELDEVIRDDGTIAGGGTVLLRMEGTAQSGPVQVGDGQFMEFERSYPMPTTGQRRLFVLSKNPNGSFSSVGVRGLLDIDGDVVRFATYDLRPVGFGAGQTPEEFVAELKRMAKASN